MDAGVFGITTPVVAIAGAFACAAWERWPEGEEKKQAMTPAAGAEEIHRRVQRIEQMLRQVD